MRNRRHETTLIFTWAIEKEDPPPSNFQPSKAPDALYSHPSRSLAYSVKGVRPQGGVLSNWLGRTPTVFSAASSENGSLTTDGCELLQQTNACGHPLNILWRLPVRARLCEPCEVQQVGWLYSAQQFIAGTLVEKVDAMPSHTFQCWGT